MTPLVSKTDHYSRSATFVELLASMAILSVLILVLSLILETTMGRFRRGIESTEERGGTRTVVDWMTRDLASHHASRSAPLPPLPEHCSAIQREFFADRHFLPFEINRNSGTASIAMRSFANAAPEFDSLAFVIRAPHSVDAEAPASLALVGYYVAYARHSPLLSDEGAGMKLFRHYRPGGHPTGEAYADGMLRFVSSQINDEHELPRGETRDLTALNRAAIRQGRFENQDLPFLISHRVGESLTHPPHAVVAPWPRHPHWDELVSPPPTRHPLRASAAAWGDPTHPIHDAVFPDEVICDHVVRFSLTPYRRVVLDDGSTELMDAAALNRYLGLAGRNEWPILVTPDLIDLVITVIPEGAARRLTHYDDWIIDWEHETAAENPLLKGSRSHFSRILLPKRSG